MRRALPVAVTALAVLLPVSASAQAMFLQGTFGGDIRRFSGEETDRVFDAATRDISIAAGGFITNHVTAGLELDVGGTSAETRSVSLTIAGRPATVTTAYSLRRRTVSAVAGLHTARGRRVQAGVYGGLSFSAVRREIASDAPPVVLSEPPEVVAFTDRTAEPVIGADVAVRMAPALAVLGGIRAHGLTSSGDLRGFTVRPRVGVRIMF